MHIDVVPNRGSRPAYLLRESYRDGTHVRKRTLANLSALSEEQIAAIRAVLRGEPLRPVGELFEVLGSRAHGHVQAVSVAMQTARLPAASERTCPARARARVRHGGRAGARPAHQARDHALVAHHDAGRGLWRRGERRERSVRGDGLAARASRRHRAEARGAPLERGRTGALRPVLELLRGLAVSARQARLQPRWQARQAAGQLRAAHRPARLPGGGVGL